MAENLVFSSLIRIFAHTIDITTAIMARDGVDIFLKQENE